MILVTAPGSYHIFHSTLIFPTNQLTNRQAAAAATSAVPGAVGYSSRAMLKITTSKNVFFFFVLFFTVRHHKWMTYYVYCWCLKNFYCFVSREALGQIRCCCSTLAAADAKANTEKVVLLV